MLLACGSHQVGAVKLLLDAGQSAVAANKAGETPLARCLASVTPATANADSQVFELLVSVVVQRLQS